MSDVPEARNGRPLEDQLREEIAAARAEIKFVGELARVEVNPGDWFVLTTPGTLSDEAALRIKEMLCSRLGPNVLVLCEGLKLGIVGTGGK